VVRTLSQGTVRPFSIGKARTELLAGANDWAARFAEDGAIVCPDIFEPEVFDRLFAAAGSARFRPDSVAGLGTREVEDPQRIGTMLNLLLQRANLFRWLERVTGRMGLVGAEGRLVQTREGNHSDQLDWHNDLENNRRALGITISFSDAAFTGGMFEMRKAGDPGSGIQFKHGTPGTALIFGLGNMWEHRVLPVSEGGPRRVYTGWFLRERVLPAGLFEMTR
jgi:hypothetical protein